MKTFMDKDFLLHTETAKKLFHGYAEEMPIFDYHNHLSPSDIANRRVYKDLYELWLETDHYKWRAMRSQGIDEKYITGDSTPYEKYLSYARILPDLIGSPLYHWTHLELQRYFGITETLNEKSAPEIWEKTKVLLKDLDAVTLLEMVKVKELCTTDDPIDSLEFHQKIREDGTISFKVRPSFRPDKYLDFTSPDREANWAKLCEKYHTTDIKEALRLSLDFFVENGCKIADHGLSVFPYDEKEFHDLFLYVTSLYKERGVVMQCHFGAIRNNSARLFKSIGPDAGGDSIGRRTDVYLLNQFLRELEEKDVLPKTILYNLEPSENEVFATTANNFAPSVQYGPAWWFNDTKRGISNQIECLMETGALSKSAGMLTDSRSFTSFVRHEYYRRILCSVLGEIVERGEYPDDIGTLGEIVKDICFRNAARLFEDM